MKYAELTSPEVQQLVEAGAVPVLPIGALEQHGRALPVGTDTLRAEGVVDRLAQRCPEGSVVTLPPLPYGVSPHHTRLPGTVTVPARLYCDLIVSLAESLADAGWQSLLIVTGHGGNRPALTLAQQELLSRRPDFRFVPIVKGLSDLPSHLKLRARRFSRDEINMLLLRACGLA